MIGLLRHAAWLVALVVLAGAALYFFGPFGGETPSANAHREPEKTEGVVRFSDEKIAAAGIELVQAGPGVLRDSILLNGILQPNQEALSQVTPRFSGIVREIGKRVGDHVKKGELLAEIESNQSLTVYELRSPIAGTIIDRNAALGEFVSDQKPVFTVADLTTVWVDFTVYRHDLSRVRVGDTVMVKAEDGASPLETKISYISPVGSSDTQSALARAVLNNSSMRLRPGLFVTGRLLLAEKPVNIAVKSSAIQTHENRTVVFVRIAETFEARDVKTGERDPHNVEILSGLTEGDVYAAKNSFVIKSEMAKAEASHAD